MDIQAKDIMNKDVISVREGTTLKEAVKILSENQINALPVLNDARRLVGIVSESDIINYSRKTHVTTSIDTKGWTNPHEKTWDRHNYQLGADILEKAYVENVMTKRVVTGKLDTTVNELARLMSRKKINHVPIVEPSGKLVGIIAREDIINFLASEG